MAKEISFEHSSFEFLLPDEKEKDFVAGLSFAMRRWNFVWRGNDRLGKASGGA
jgi:hypothetical protein